VAVNVEEPGADGGKAGEPALLARLPERHREEVRVAVGVAAQLQPFAELAVQGQQGLPAVGANDPGRTRQVPGRARAQQAVGMGFGKSDRRLDGEGLLPGERSVPMRPQES